MNRVTVHVSPSQASGPGGNLNLKRKLQCVPKDESMTCSAPTQLYTFLMPDTLLLFADFFLHPFALIPAFRVGSVPGPEPSPAQAINGVFRIPPFQCCPEQFYKVMRPQVEIVTDKSFNRRKVLP